MKPKDIKLYQFDDGWSVWRILDIRSSLEFFGRSFVLRGGESLFGLVDKEGEARSSLWMEIGKDIVYHGGSFDQVSDSIKPFSTEPSMSYWREFLEQCFSDWMNEKVELSKPIVIPDGLRERLLMPLLEQEMTQKLKDLSRVYDAAMPGTKQWVKPLNRIKDHIHNMVIKGFTSHYLSDATGSEPFFKVSRESPRPSTVSGLSSFESRVRFRSDGEDFLVSFSFWGEGGNVMLLDLVPQRISREIRGTSLIDVWDQYTREWEEKHLRPFVPESQVDAWYEQHTMPGQSCFDLEPYFLVNAQSPYLMQDDDFVLWVSQIRS